MLNIIIIIIVQIQSIHFHHQQIQSYTINQQKKTNKVNRNFF